MTCNYKTVLATAVAALMVAPAAQATNGYFAHAYSIKEKGIAGAGVALPQDTLAAATNPAGMVLVGNRIDAGLALFSPRRSYTVTGNPSGPPAFGLAPGTVDSNSEYFPIPSFGWNRMLDVDQSIGISVYGNGGMNTDYPASAGDGSGTFYGGSTGVDLMQLFVNFSYARQLTPSTSVGISPILAYQRFEGKGVGAFGAFSSDPANLSDRGHDSSFGYGAKFGISSEVQPGFTVGATYQTEMRMDEFDRYRGLFAERGGFDIPSTATIGLAWETTLHSVLVFDVQHIRYSDIASVGRPILPALGQAQQGDENALLGANGGPGFGWRDMTIYKIGYQWETSPDWTWRVGFSYGEQPIPSSEVLFNILAPGVIERHVTAGFTQRLGVGGEWSLALMYAPEKEVRGVNPLDPAQQIELRMDQWELGASYAWEF